MNLNENQAEVFPKMARLKLSPDIFTRAWHGKGPVHSVYKEPRFGENGMASSISPSFTFGLDGFSSDSAHINLLKLWLVGITVRLILTVITRRVRKGGI